MNSEKSSLFEFGCPHHAPPPKRKGHAPEGPGGSAKPEGRDLVFLNGTLS